MKKSFFILSLMATTTLMANAKADEVNCGDDCTWSYDATTKTLTITGSGAMKNYGTGEENLSVSDYQAALYRAERPWNSIASQVEHIVVSGFESLGNRAFSHMTNVKTIELSDSITNLGYSTFYSTNSLEHITIPNGVTRVPKSLFGIPNNTQSSLKSITLPDGLTTIDDWAFRNCKQLESIVIPDTVTSIGNSTFAWANNLQSIVIGENVTNLEKDTFYNAPGTIFCPNTVVCSGQGMNGFSGTVQYYTKDANGVYKVGDIYYASAEDMGHVGENGALSPIACANYDKCKEDALTQMVQKGSLCTTTQGCKNLIAMVKDENYDCDSLATCSGAVKNGTITGVNLAAADPVIAGNGGTGSSTGSGKRIYTVEEALQAVEAAGTDTVKFRIRYK